MEKKYKSLAEHTEHLEKENKRLNAAIQLLLAEKRQWVESKALQQQVVHQQITKGNEDNHRNQEEIQRLRNEIKRVTGGAGCQ